MNTFIKKIAIFSLFITMLFSNSISAQCGGNTYYNPYEVCRVKQVKEIFVKKEVKDNIVLEPLYTMRAQVLCGSARGRRYIMEYDYVSKITADSKIDTELSTLLEIVTAMPMIYESYTNYIDTKYDGVIINSKLSNSISIILNDHKKLSNDSKYLSIIDNLLLDLKSITNKSKKDVISFMGK